MIVTVELNCIFENGNPNADLKRYSRAFLTACKDFGMDIVLITPKNVTGELKKRLKIEMLGFISINRFPIKTDAVTSFDGFIQIRPQTGKVFSWIEVRESFKDILLMDYYAFNQRYIARAMNEPDIKMEFVQEQIHEMSQA